MKEIECQVTGKVQMVMFRDFVCRKARGLGVVGFVQNKDDRSVYVLAQGDEKDLEKLTKYLHKGPFLARVARVIVEWREPRSSFSGFEIRY